MAYRELAFIVIKVWFLTIITPSGQIIHGAGPSVKEYQKSETSILYSIDNPEQGTWTAQVVGVDVPDDGELFTLLMDSPPSPPDLTNPSDQTIPEGKILSLNLIATDPDNDPLTYSFSSSTPLSGATLTGNTFTWTPGSGSAGTYSVTFKATDSGGLSDEETIIITVYAPVEVRIVPNTLNIASKGKLVAFITLPRNYKTADVDPISVMCEGAPALRLIRINAFPQTFAAIFNREKLANVESGDTVQFIVTGVINEDGQKIGFSGSDTLRVISKATKEKEITDDVITMADDKIFNQFNPGLFFR